MSPQASVSQTSSALSPRSSLWLAGTAGLVPQHRALPCQSCWAGRGGRAGATCLKPGCGGAAPTLPVRLRSFLTASGRAPRRSPRRSPSRRSLPRRSGGHRSPAVHGAARKGQGRGGAAQEPEAAAGEAPPRAHQREPEPAQGAHSAAAGQRELPLLEAGEGGHPGNDRALPAGAACVPLLGGGTHALRQLPRGLQRLPCAPGRCAARLPRPGARRERAPAGALATEGGWGYPRRRACGGLWPPALANPEARAPHAPAASASQRPWPLAAVVALCPDHGPRKLRGTLGRLRKLSRWWLLFPLQGTRPVATPKPEVYV